MSGSVEFLFGLFAARAFPVVVQAFKSESVFSEFHCFDFHGHLLQMISIRMKLTESCHSVVCGIGTDPAVGRTADSSVMYNCHIITCMHLLNAILFERKTLFWV